MTMLLAAFSGLLLGLMINYLADRLPWERSLGYPLCHICGASQGWLDYLLMRRCPHCGKAVAWRNYVVLLLSVLLGIWITGKYGWWVFLTLEYFLLVAVMDIEHRVILYPVSLLGIVLGLLVGALAHGWPQTLVGGAVGGGFMYLLYLGGRAYGRWASKRHGLDVPEEGLGFGDVTLSFILGLILGLSQVLTGLILGVLLAGIFGVVYLLVSRGRAALQPIPYAPFLLLGALLLLLR